MMHPTRALRAFVRLRTPRTLHALAVSVVLGASACIAGCAAVPVDEVAAADALDVRILGTSDRAFRPWKGGRFVLGIKNTTSRTIRFDRLDVVLAASPEGFPSVRSLSGRWRYPLPEPIVLAAGKEFTIPLTPEPLEFHLGTLLPGGYNVQATLFERFTSGPFLVRVDRPDLPRSVMRQ